MCQSNVYVVEEDREELVQEDVAFIEVEGDSISLRSLFGEPLSLRGRVIQIDLMKHRVLLEKSGRERA